MSELPNGWAATKLGDTLTLNYGKSLPATKRDGGKFPVYGSNGIVGQHSEAITGEPAIVVGRKGSFGEVHYCDGRCFPIDTTYFVDGFDATDPRFAFHLLRHLPLTEMNRASAIPGLNREDAYSLAIGLPPLPEQRRIVAKVDGLTARTARARKELDRIPTLIARYKQRVLALAFSGGLTAGWRKQMLQNEQTHFDDVRKSRANDKRLARRKRPAQLPNYELPEGWAWVSPDEVAADAKYSIGIGPFGSNLVRTDYRESGVRLVFVRDIRREEFEEADARYIDESKAAELHQHIASPGDVLITKMGDPPGDSALFPMDAKPAVITADCIKLTPHDQLATAKFLNFAIRSEIVQSQFKAITAGVAQQKVSLDRFRQLALPVAPLEEQAEIVRRIESAFGWLDRMAADHAAVARLLPILDAAILAKAFRGELVPQDPNDEPASVLLERVTNGRASYEVVKTSSQRNRKSKARAPRKAKASMTKSRHHPDVWQKPYLADILKNSKNSAKAEELFSLSDLELVDFYHQLSIEYENGWLVEADGRVKVA